MQDHANGEQTLCRRTTPSHIQSFCCDKDCHDQSENFQIREFDN